MSDVKAAGVICFAQEGKKTLFLMLRSSKHGEWGPPKGHAEPGETEIETATREFFEETGLRRISFESGFRESITYNVEKKGNKCLKEVVFFLCRIDPDLVQISAEHSEIHLGTIDEVEVLILHEDVKAVFRRAQEFITAPERN